MKLDAGEAIAEIVEAILPRFTQEKVLHVSIQVNYLCFPHSHNDTDNCSDEINKTVFINYVFYRASNYTMVLCLENYGSSFIDNGNIFHRTSYHDSCWRSDGVKDNLNKIHCRIMEEIGEKYKKIMGCEMPIKENWSQPNFCRIEKIELLSGTVVDIGNENREYKIEKDVDKINFVQIK